MPGIACPQCQQELELELQENGYCHCSCGEVVLVPRVVQPDKAPGSQATRALFVEEDLVHVCQCGKTLRVSGKAKGKKLRCPCGKSFIAGSVPDSKPLSKPTSKPATNSAAGSPSPSVSQPVAPSTPRTSPPQRPAPQPAKPQPIPASNGLNDLLSDLPPVTMDSYAANSQANTYASSSSSHSTNPYSLASGNYGKGSTRERSSEPNVALGVLGGLIMTVGAYITAVFAGTAIHAAKNGVGDGSMPSLGTSLGLVTVGLLCLALGFVLSWRWLWNPEDPVSSFEVFSILICDPVPFCIGIFFLVQGRSRGVRLLLTHALLVFVKLAVVAIVWNPNLS